MICMVLRIFGNSHDLLDHSERDPMTGLLNRQTVDTAFMNRTHRPSARGTSVQPRPSLSKAGATGLGIADIDHFKRVNDLYGHLIGDEVLMLMSRLLRSSFRYHDRLYRFVGEEFVVLMDGLKVEQAAGAFERLRANVGRFAFPQVGQIEVSMGFTRTADSDASSVAFSPADKALYHAKGTGRNRVAQFEKPLHEGFVVETNLVGNIELF